MNFFRSEANRVVRECYKKPGTDPHTYLLTYLQSSPSRLARVLPEVADRSVAELKAGTYEVTKKILTNILSTFKFTVFNYDQAMLLLLLSNAPLLSARTANDFAEVFEMYFDILKKKSHKNKKLHTSLILEVVKNESVSNRLLRVCLSLKDQFFYEYEIKYKSIVEYLFKNYTHRSALLDPLLDTANVVNSDCLYRMIIKKGVDYRINTVDMIMKKEHNKFLVLKCCLIVIGDMSRVVDSSKLDSSKLDNSKVDSSKLDSSKIYNSKLDENKVDSSKLDGKLVDAKVDSSKVDSSKLDGKLVDAKVDSSKLDENKVDSSKLDGKIQNDNKSQNSKIDDNNMDLKYMMDKKNELIIESIKERIDVTTPVGTLLDWSIPFLFEKQVYEGANEEKISCFLKTLKNVHGVKNGRMNEISDEGVIRFFFVFLSKSDPIIYGVLFRKIFQCDLTSAIEGRTVYSRSLQRGLIEHVLKERPPLDPVFYFTILSVYSAVECFRGVLSQLLLARIEILNLDEQFVTAFLARARAVYFITKCKLLRNVLIEYFKDKMPNNYSLNETEAVLNSSIDYDYAGDVDVFNKYWKKNSEGYGKTIKSTVDIRNLCGRMSRVFKRRV